MSSVRTRTFFAVAALTVCLAAIQAQAQVTVTNPGNTTPGMLAIYPSLATAITDLNLQTAISGPVTITLSGNETAPSGGYTITASLTGASAVNNIVIEGSSSTITASPAQAVGVLHDAIFELVGADFITIRNFTMVENAANLTTTAASNNMTEWGVALLYGSTTNGAQNITIQNNTISLNRAYQNTFGIYSNSTHTTTAVTTSATATGPGGGNSGLKVYGNTISNVNNGIVIVGPTAAADAQTGVDVGGAGGAQANSISNYGTTGTFSGYANVSGTVNGILVRNSIGFNVSFNSVTSSVGGTTVGTLNGIQVPGASTTPTGTFTNTINNNNISLQSAVAAGAINGINCPSGSASTTSTININNNNFHTFGHTVAASGTIAFIIQSSTHLTTSISNNTFTNVSVNTTGSVTFISNSVTSPAGSSKNINNNSIVTQFSKTGAGGTITFFTDNGSDVNGAIQINQNNNFSNITVTGATTIAGWSNTAGASSTNGPNKTITGNTFSNITGGTSGVTATTLNFGGPTTFSNNTISNLSGGGAITGVAIGTSNGQGTHTYSSNTISGLNSSGTGGQVVGIIGGSTSIPTLNITGNSISNLSSTGSAIVCGGIGLTTAPTTANISGNTIDTISNNSASTSSADGILIQAATTANVFKNKICNITRNGAPTANGVCQGLRISAGVTVNAFNNLIGNLNAPVASQTDAVRGISITSTTALATYNVYFNTVYMNAASTGTNFGTSGVFHANNATATTAKLDLRNNIIVNTSTPAGTGFTVAHRRSAATVFPANYATTSNNNLFYCGTPDASHLIYDDSAGGSDQTLLDYQTRVSPADSASITGDPSFLSTTCSNAGFLHIPSTSIVIGAAQPIAGITDDFDGELRDSTTPDIGADEFVVNCSGIPLVGTINGPSAVCSGFGTTLTLVGASSDNGITYQWKSGTTPGGPYPNTLGTGVTQATGVLTSPAYFICEVTCNLSSQTATTAEKAVLVNPNPTVTVSPTSGLICNPGGAAVDLTASGALTYSWSPAAGLSATTGDMVSANPTATTTYTVTGTDANGCTGTANVTITVTNKPLVSASATPPTVCPGGSSQLNAIASKAVGPNYDISSLTGQTYTTLTGGGITIINTSAQLTVGFSTGNQDDGGVLITLPFTFTYMGNPFTQVCMSTNGWISPGATQATITAGPDRTPANLFNTTAPNNTIAAWFKDMGANFPLGTGSMRHGLIGADIYAFQWDKAIGSGFTDPSTILISFQINIHGPASATPGRVEMIYGPTAGAVAFAASIGIENATGGANQFINALNGSTTSTATSTLWPGNGNGFRFDPPTFTYQWSPATFLDNPSIANPLASGVTTTTVYTVTATAASGCTNTADVTVTVEDTQDPVIVTCASDQNVTADSNCEAIVPDFTAGVSATDNCSFTVTQSPLAGSTVSGAGPVNIVITVTDTSNNTDTCNATLNVLDPLSIVTGPQNASGCVGDPASFSVVANGAAGYQWRHNTNPLLDGGNISGATTPTLSINPIGLADAGVYDVVVTSVCGGTQTSTPASLSVNTAPVIGLQPVGGIVGAGSPFSFTVGASGGGLSYQWYRGVTPLIDGGNISGANSPMLTINPTTLADSGSYTVVVSNSCGTDTSDAAVLTVNAFATVSLVSPPCVNTNQLIVDVYMSASTSVIVGGQFFFAYNNTVLDFVSATPGDAPFLREVYEVVNEPAGEINYAVGINDNDVGTIANTVMARLTFNVLQDVCTLTPNLVTWRASGPNGAENKLSNDFGEPVEVNEVDLGAIRIDNVAPVITSCPTDINVHAAPGSCNSAPVTYAAAASDNCTGSPTITFNPPSGSTFGPGSTPVLVTATDECGNSSTCTFNVINDGMVEISAEVELGGGAMANGTFNRAITFALWNTGVNMLAPLHTTCVNMSFSGNFPAPKLGTATFLVPCQPTGYDCITARDRLHTLRRTISPIPVVGPAYAPSFTGVKALIGGNLDDSKFIDILDFGIYTTQDLTLAPGGANTVCGQNPPGFLHADITGNGVVNSLDYSFIANNFLMVREPNCNGDPNSVVATNNGDRSRGRADEQPVTSITIGELADRGLSSLAVMDLNQDGVFDLADKALWDQGVRPSTAGGTAPAGGSLKPSQNQNLGTGAIPVP